VAASVRIHYHRPDRGTTIFVERLVRDEPDVKVTLLSDYQEADAYAGDRLILSTGAPVLWFVFPGLCRDVGRFHLADGTFTGWYTNLRAPIKMDGSEWYCTDLFLDHWLPADGTPGMWLDEDELAAAIEKELLTDDLLACVRRERAEVEALWRTDAWPPPLARQLDLRHALTELG
jgi:predicted RNA-binding protein associated with RNAse of E/G family